MLLIIYLFYYEVVQNYVYSIENLIIKLDNSMPHKTIIRNDYEIILNQQHNNKTRN